MRAIIFLMLAAKSIINGSFFIKNQRLGLIGGVFTACTIAAVNIFFSFLLGRMTVQVNHRNLIRKAVGAIIFLAFLVFAIGFNLFVAHFREVGAGQLGGSNPAGSRQFWADPAGLTIFNSWILVLVGFAFATVAWIEGYGWDDPYPGFGDVWRRWERSIADYAHEKESLLEEAATPRTRSSKPSRAPARISRRGSGTTSRRPITGTICGSRCRSSWSRPSSLRAP